MSIKPLLTVLAGSLLVSGCADRVQDEQDRLAMVQKSGSVEDVCLQSRKVAAAALEKKSPRYAEYAVHADGYCLTAQMKPGMSYDQASNASATIIEADNMDVMSEEANVPVERTKGAPVASRPRDTGYNPNDWGEDEWQRNESAENVAAYIEKATGE